MCFVGGLAVVVMMTQKKFSPWTDSFEIKRQAITEINIVYKYKAYLLKKRKKFLIHFAKSMWVASDRCAFAVFLPGILKGEYPSIGFDAITILSLSRLRVGLEVVEISSHKLRCQMKRKWRESYKRKSRPQRVTWHGYIFFCLF